MTDREEFEKWFGNDIGYKSANKELYRKIKEVMELAWQARGELDAVRIKELQSREWVGLSDDEIEQIVGEEINVMYSGDYKTYRAIEAKLREKNNG